MKKKTAPKNNVKGGPKVLHDFYRNLKNAVEDTGLSPYTLAKKIGLDRQIIRNILQGNSDPKISTVIGVAKGMQLSMDWLIGNVSGGSSVPVTPEPNVEVKKENLNFIDIVSKMPKQDVELLEAIAGILNERRAQSIARLLHAVQDTKLPGKKNEGGLMAKASASVEPAKRNVSLPDDEGFEDFEDFEDDDGFDDDLDENDEFDDDSEFDEDEEFDDDDDFDED